MKKRNDSEKLRKILRILLLIVAILVIIVLIILTEINKPKKNKYCYYSNTKNRLYQATCYLLDNENTCYNSKEN